MRIKNLWKKQTVASGFLLLCLLSAAITMGAEALFNFRALTTAGLTPVELPPDYFTCDSQTAVFDEKGIHLQMGPSDAITLHNDMVYEPTRTVHVALEGEGTVQVTVELMDESFAYLRYPAYRAWCVAGDPALQNLYATAGSAGTAYELYIRFDRALDSADFTVRSVTLNAPVPFRFKLLRMLLVFGAALSVLCALFLRGWDTAYQPRRPLHRAIVILPVVGMMVFAVLIVSWQHPQGRLFAGLPREEALRTNDIYAALTNMLLENRVMLDEEPSEALLNLANPYDPTERAFFYGTFKYDYVLFEGRYYVYFGLAPALGVYAPYYALTGRFPASSDSILILGLLAIGLIGWAVLGMANRYAKGANVFALSLCCVTVVFASGVFWLISAETFYHLPILALICFSAGAIGFGYHAAEQKRAWLRIAQYALSGLCFGLAVMTRMTALPVLVALIAPLFVFELLKKRAKFPHALAFLIPAAAGLGIVFWYNAARFGSILDFGYSNQLTTLDSHYQKLCAADFPHALYHYLLTPVTFSGEFPYLSAGWGDIGTLGGYKFISYSVGMLAFPITWGAALMRLSRPQGDRGRLSPASERRWAFLAAIAVSILCIWISYCLAGNIMRYVCDFLFFFSLIGALCVLPVMTKPGTPERRALCAICVLLCLTSILVSFCLLFSNAAQIKLQSPQVYFKLQRMFYPY
jgi:hypothetical protein